MSKRYVVKAAPDLAIGELCAPFHAAWGNTAALEQALRLAHTSARLLNRGSPPTMVEWERWIGQSPYAVVESSAGAVVEANAPCNGSCDIELARRQVGPDGIVPGSARECAELWEQEAARLRKALVVANANHERFERLWYLAQDEIESLREKVPS